MVEMVYMGLYMLCYIGATPLFLACTQGHSDTAVLLLDNGANIEHETLDRSIITLNNISPLIIALMIKPSEITLMLLGLLYRQGYRH